MPPPAVYTLKFTSLLSSPPTKNVPPPGKPPSSTLPAPIVASCADAMEHPAARSKAARKALEPRLITILLCSGHSYTPHGTQNARSNHSLFEGKVGVKLNCYNFSRANLTIMAVKRAYAALPILALLGGILGFYGVSLAQFSGSPAFAQQIHELSEPGGSFDTDNLSSNERSYLHILPALRQVRGGGAYIGVGPDQNFSYIAAARPSIAFLIDVRRDNLLLHLLFK